MYTCTLLHFELDQSYQKVPVVPVEMLPPVVVCTAVSSLVHEIVSPAFIETFDGIKHLSASSHPGTDVPEGMLTYFVIGPVSSFDNSTTTGFPNRII